MADEIGTKVSQLPLGENLGDSDLMYAVEGGISKKVEVGYLKEVFGGGSDVSITPTLQSGTKIADYVIDETSGAMYVPTAPTALSELTDDSTHRVVTDAEKTTWSGKADATDFIGATSSVAGGHGLVPAPLIGDDNKYLKGDGTWSEVQSGTSFYTTENVNFFDNTDADIVTSKMIDGYGSMTNSNDFDVSGYIPILPNVSYECPIFSGKIGVTAKALPIYDGNKNYIQRLVGTEDSTTKRVTFTSTNENARYVRINIPKRGIKTLYVTPWHYYGIFMFTRAPFPTKYYSFGEKQIIDDEYHLSSDQETNFNPLIGKYVAFYGDSICYGDDYDGWAGRIGRKNGMTWENMGISGATFYKNNVAGCIAEQNVPFSTIDYIIIEGGTNDADRIGNSISDPKPQAFGSYDWTYWGTNEAASNYGFDITTFCGALEFMFKKMTLLYPNAKIGYIAAHKMGRTDDYRPTANNRRFFFETAMDICKKWGIPYINLWDECQLNPSNPSMYNSESQGDENYDYIDGQHLTAKGYEVVTPKIEAWMKTL